VSVAARLRASGYRTLLNSGVAVIVVIVIMSAVLVLGHLHRQAGLRTAVTTQNLARSLDQTISGLIGTIDIALLASAREIGRQASAGRVEREAVNAMLIAQRQQIPAIAYMNATSASGDLVYGPEIPSPPVNIADRAYFGRLAAGPEAGLVVDEPLRGLASGRWVWTFARRVERADGSFAGVVLAAVRLDEIEEMIAELKLAGGSSVTLRDAGLRLVARHPPAYLGTGAIGEKRHSPAFQDALARHPDEGSYGNGSGSVDGVERSFSYRRNARYGYVVNVGIDEASTYAEWRLQASGVAGLAALLIGGLLAFARVVGGAWRRQDEAVAALEAAQQIARLGHYHVDLRCGAWTSSAMFDEICGIDASYPRDARHWVELAAADCRQAHQEYTQTVIAQRLPFVREYRVVRRTDGEERWVFSQAEVQVDADGKPQALVGTILDITERKRIEADLRIAARAFDAQEAMVITDRNSVILRVNRAFTENTGYSAEEAIGQTPRLLKSCRHDDEFFRAMWESVTCTGGWQGEIWDRRKDGEEYQKWLTISAVKDDAGAVTHYIGAQYDITARKQAEEKINELAFFDPLTGLPNRTLLRDRLRQAMTASGRSGSYCALLFVDLDHFKTLNDSLGHEVGDSLLKQVAQRLVASVREGDTVSRVGGDDFVVILSGLAASAADAANATEMVARKILALLDHIYQFGELAHYSSASIGATLFKGSASSADDLMKQSDLTMYKAKAAGRNTFLFFDPAMEVAAQERAALEGDLRQALDGEQFFIEYQAQVSGDGRLTGAEVLVRWKHPRRGVVAPAEFIPLAEEAGLIVPLGNWVLETACRQLARWAAEPAMAALTVAVNVSAQQFVHSDFVDLVVELLARTGANPQRLKLELTESLLVDNVEAVIAKMFALKALGVGFSLDDFGTGYSSLAYLKRLPLDQLKIDQSFVRDVLVDVNDAIIARTIVALAHSLGLGVIAEGVETEAQRDFLASAGCHAYQGYFFSRPLPIDRFERFAQTMRLAGSTAEVQKIL